MWPFNPPDLDRRLAFVRALPRAQRDAVLTAALNHADRAERDPIALEALRAAAHPLSKPLVGTVLAHWDLLSLHTRRRALETVSDDLPAVFRRLRASENPAERRAAVVLAVACLADALEREADREADLPPALDEAALRDPRLAEELDAVLAEAANRLADNPNLRSAEIRTDPVLAIIARVAHAPGPKLRDWLNTPAEGHMHLRALAKALPKADQLQRAVPWLALKALRPSAITALEAEPIPGANQLAHRSHLLLARSRTKALRRLRDPLKMIPTGQALRALPAPDRVGAVRLTKLFEAKPEHRVARLAAHLTDSAPEVRLAAVNALAFERPSPDLDGLLLDFALDDNPRVAARATSILTSAETHSRRVALLPTYETLQRSPHPSVRRLAARAIRAADHWADAEQADQFACPIAALRAYKQDPQTFIDELITRASEGDAQSRARAMRLADRLNLLEHIESTLIETVKSDNRNLAATAVALLGKLPGPGPASVIRLAMAHDDPRVRANALESHARLDPDSPKIEVLVEDATPRIRANALHHLLRRAPDSATHQAELASMLADDRAGHRLSALWVAERLSQTILAQRVAEIARTDPDPQTSRRAVRCARRLLAEMRANQPRAAITTRAATPEPALA